MRIVQLTDPHIYAAADARFASVDTRATLQAVLAELPRRIDLLVVTGDLSMEGEPGAYTWLRAALDATGLPYLGIAGNHDTPAAWDADGPFLPSYAQRTYGRWQLHFLNTWVAEAPHGLIGRAGLAALADGLAARPAAHHLLFLHHPPLPLGSPWLDAMGLLDAPVLWELLTQHAGVRALVCGHVHQNFDTWHNGVRVLMTPSTCVQFAPRSSVYAVDRRAPAYRVIELDAGGGLSTTVRRVSARAGGVQPTAPRQ